MQKNDLTLMERAMENRNDKKTQKKRTLEEKNNLIYGVREVEGRVLKKVHL